MYHHKNFWKTEQGKKLMAKGGIFILFLLVLGSPTYALSYDLQPYTTCNNGYCTTSLDISTLGFSTQKINTLKAINITNFLNKSGIIYDFTYNWNGNILTISGRINENVYWSFGAGQDKFDPWWNLTSSTINVYNSTYSKLALPLDENSGVVAYDKSPLLNNASLQYSDKWATGVYGTAYQFNGSGTHTINKTGLNFAGQGTWSFWIKTGQSTGAVWYDLGSSTCANGDQFQIGMNINGTGKVNILWNATRWNSCNSVINDNAWHFVAITYNGTHMTCYLNNSASTITTDGTPAQTSIGTSTAGIWFGNCGNANYFSGYIDEFQVWNRTLSSSDLTAVMNSGINQTTSTKYFYDTDLFLNGNASNITINNTNQYKQLNISAGLTGNLTGNWNLSLYVNTTYYNSSNNNVTNRTNLGNGLYPITVEFMGNGTLPAFNKTYYANITGYITPTPGDVSAVINIDLNSAPLTCANTTHAMRNTTFYNNYSSVPLAEIYYCSTGCDNYWVRIGGCNPETWQINLIIITIVGIMFIGVMKFIRWI